MKRGLIYIVGLAVIAVVVGGFAYYQYVWKPGQSASAGAGQQRPPAVVSAVAAKSESWQASVPAIGTVTARQGVNVAAEVPGTVAEILFESGAQVDAGDPLVEMNLTTETAELEAAQASLRESGRQLQRQRELNKRGVASGQSLDDAIAKRDNDRAEVERINALIAEKKIDAPFAGYLGIRQVDIGQYVSAGETLVSLQQLDPIYIDFPLPENRLKDVAVGDTVNATVDAVPGETFNGKIETVDTRVNQSTRNILVRASFPNPNRKLLPGMFASLRVIDSRTTDVVTVPRTGVTISLVGDTVFVAKPDPAPAGGNASQAQGGPVYTLEQRRVTVGEQRGETIVIADGVKAGEMVVIAGQNKIFNGQKVRLSKEPAIEAPATRPRS
ncbi:MAG: efflux RND transporter periplasmic adaptor subunit [Alphaproteobacteria bacterium]|nr:efflux RND transporter periplasmic adaptor subunit [Alphaproteobacteria bacterium]